MMKTLRRILCFTALPVLMAAVSSCTENDPCRGVDCSGHGRCVAEGLTPRCFCEPDYVAVGLSCCDPAADDDCCLELCSLGAADEVCDERCCTAANDLDCCAQADCLAESDGCCPEDCTAASDADCCNDTDCAEVADGCCPPGCDATADPDCCDEAECGDEDGCCPDECTAASDPDCCDRADCGDEDGCCPEGCAAAADPDCCDRAECGDEDGCCPEGCDDTEDIDCCDVWESCIDNVPDDRLPICCDVTNDYDVCNREGCSRDDTDGCCPDGCSIYEGEENYDADCSCVIVGEVEESDGRCPIGCWHAEAPPEEQPDSDCRCEIEEDGLCPGGCNRPGAETLPDGDCVCDLEVSDNRCLEGCRHAKAYYGREQRDIDCYCSRTQIDGICPEGCMTDRTSGQYHDQDCCNMNRSCGGSSATDNCCPSGCAIPEYGEEVSRDGDCQCVASNDGVCPLGCVTDSALVTSDSTNRYDHDCCNRLPCSMVPDNCCPDACDGTTGATTDVDCECEGTVEVSDGACPRQCSPDESDPAYDPDCRCRNRRDDLCLVDHCSVDEIADNFDTDCCDLQPCGDDDGCCPLFCNVAEDDDCRCDGTVSDGRCPRRCWSRSDDPVLYDVDC